MKYKQGSSKEAVSAAEQEEDIFGSQIVDNALEVAKAQSEMAAYVQEKRNVQHTMLRSNLAHKHRETAKKAESAAEAEKMLAEHVRIPHHHHCQIYHKHHQ